MAAAARSRRRRARERASSATSCPWWCDVLSATAIRPRRAAAVLSAGLAVSGSGAAQYAEDGIAVRGLPAPPLAGEGVDDPDPAPAAHHGGRAHNARDGDRAAVCDCDDDRVGVERQLDLDVALSPRTRVSERVADELAQHRQSVG